MGQGITHIYIVRLGRYGNLLLSSYGLSLILGFAFFDDGELVAGAEASLLTDSALDWALPLTGGSECGDEWSLLAEREVKPMAS